MSERWFKTSYGKVKARLQKEFKKKASASKYAKGLRKKGWGLVRRVKTKTGYAVYARYSW